jgi:hypothetical protein
MHRLTRRIHRTWPLTLLIIVTMALFVHLYYW